MNKLAIVAAAMLIGATNAAGAAEIDALITTAMKAAIDELVPPFERQNGHAVRVSYGPSGGISRRFLGGEPADLIVIDSGALDDLDQARQGAARPHRRGAHRDRHRRAQGRTASPTCRRPTRCGARCSPRNPSATPRRPAAASRRRT